MEESGITLRPDITSNIVCPVVLMIHDEPFSQTFRGALEGSGCRVEEVSSSEVTLDLFQRLCPGLVILDLVMQGMNGFDTCVKLRSLENGRHTPILVLAEHQDAACIHRVFEAGATDFLSKPVSAELLGYRAHYLLRAGRALEELTRGGARHRLLKAAVESLPIGITLSDGRGKNHLYQPGRSGNARLRGEGITAQGCQVAGAKPPARLQASGKD